MQSQGHVATEGRNVGLDIVRSAAILMVIGYHTWLTSPLAEQFGFLGVEIFFVLSGFLIARIAFEQFQGVQTPHALVSFWVSRLLRTLPLYYLFVAVFVWAAYNPWLFHAATSPFASRVVLPDIWPFLTFTQNLTGNEGSHFGWFSISWTLAIEEWFYLAFPVLLWLTRRQNANHTLFAAAAAVVVAVITLRAHRYAINPAADFDIQFRRPVIFRFDTFFYGVLTYVATHRCGIDTRPYHGKLAILGLAGLLLSTLLVMHPATRDFHLHVTYLSLTPFVVALILPSLWSLDVTSKTVRAWSGFISTRTYAAYLCHLLVIDIFATQIAPMSASTRIAVVGLTFVVADVIYRTVERPILRLRSRILANLASRQAERSHSAPVLTTTSSLAG